jgi:hypothetical protein
MRRLIGWPPTLAKSMRPPHAAHKTIPNWLRWSALVWLVFWMAVYWRFWGAANFLHLCDITVILSCIGLWSNSALLISSQAVGSLLVDAAWALDAGWRFFLGHHLTGGTEYLFDPRYPLWIRLLTLFHVVTPPLLLWAVCRLGYDRRGWALQSGIAVAAFAAARFTSPALNINFAFSDPFFHRAWGPPAVHVALSALVLIIIAYVPTHLCLKHFFAPPAQNEIPHARD